MHTLKLNISDTIYDKLIGLLKKFDKSELEIVQDDKVFLANKEYLHNEHAALKNGQAKFVSADELNNSVEKVVRKHDD